MQERDSQISVEEVNFLRLLNRCQETNGKLPRQIQQYISALRAQLGELQCQSDSCPEKSQEKKDFETRLKEYSQRIEILNQVANPHLIAERMVLGEGEGVGRTRERGDPPTEHTVSPRQALQHTKAKIVARRKFQQERKKQLMETSQSKNEGTTKQTQKDPKDSTHETNPKSLSRNQPHPGSPEPTPSPQEKSPENKQASKAQHKAQDDSKTESKSSQALSERQLLGLKRRGGSKRGETETEGETEAGAEGEDQRYESQMQFHQEDHNRRIEALVGMARSLKHQMQAAHSTILNDNKVLDATAESAQGNQEKMKQQNLRLDKQLNETATTSRLTCAVLLFVLLMFLATYTVIKLFPPQLTHH